MARHEHRCRECGTVYPCWGRKRALCPGEDEPVGACKQHRGRRLTDGPTLEENLEILEFLGLFEVSED